MTEIRKRRWWIYALLLAALLVVAAPFAVLTLLWSGWADTYVRDSVVGQLGKITGGTVELHQFHFNPWGLQATLGDLTIHGREASGQPPFFHVDRLAVQLRVDSVWQHKISVATSKSSIPPSTCASPRMAQQRARAGASTHSLQADSRTHLRSGHPQTARRRRLPSVQRPRIPLDAQGGQLEFAMDYSAAENHPRTWATFAGSRFAWP